MNQAKMNLDEALPASSLRVVADANRLRRLGTTFAGLFCAICILLPSPVEAECPQWYVSGSWTIQQSDGYTVQVNLRQTGKKLTGKATYFYDIRNSDDRSFGAKYPSANGSATGNIGGDDFYCEIKWETGPVGVYSAKVSSGGRVHGTLYDKSNPNRSKATWFSTDLMHCGEQKFASSASSGALPPPMPIILSQTPPPPTQSSPKRLISHKGKGSTAVNAPETAEAAAAKGQLRSGNPRGFAGTWNTTKKGETIILNLQVNGNSVTGDFASTSNPENKGTLTGTIAGDDSQIVQLRYTSEQPIEAAGTFSLSADGKLEGGYTWREPGKAKKTYVRWNGTRASN